jgi:hypothetical protein
MAVPAWCALGGRDGGRPGTGGARGSARAAARRAPQVLRRSCQPSDRAFPAGAKRQPRRVGHPLLRLPAHDLARDHAPDGARRDPCALEDVRESSHRPLGTR